MEPRTEHPASKSVLVVDDDPTSLRILEVSLRSEGFDVETAADAGAASTWLAKHVPGLVIASTTLPDVDGFELCRRVKGQTGHAAVPVMLMGEAGAANRIRGIEAGAEEFVSKPIFVRDVVGRVSLLLRRQNRQRLQTDAGAEREFSGTLADISVVDLIQTLQEHRRSGVIHLQNPQSGGGEIYFRQGAVVDAEVGRLSGREAIFRLLSWTQGTYRIEPKSIRRKDAIGLGPTALVMEGMRRLDDWQRLLKDLPPLPTVFEVDYRVLAERLAEIPDEVNGILRLFDGTRTLLNVIDDCGISDAEALGLVGKLYGEGIIRDVQAPAEESAPAAPAAEGWLTEAAGPFRPPAAAEAEPEPEPEPEVEGDTETAENDIHRRPTGPVEPLEKLAMGGEGGHGNDVQRDTRVDLFVAEMEALGEQPASEEDIVATPSAPIADAVATPIPDEAVAAAAAPEPSLLEPEPEPPLPESEPPAAAATLSIAGPAGPPVPEAAPAPGSSGAIPRMREDESAVVIASTSDGDVRRTLLAAGGIPDLALPSPAGTPTEIVGALGDVSAAATRSTEPGMGPAAPVPVQASPSVEALLASAEPLPPAPVAAAGTPASLSESASNWMQPDDSFPRNTSEALDELNLPSRHRGVLLLLGGAVLVAGAFVGGQLWFARHPGAERPSVVEKAKPPVDPEPPAVMPAPPALAVVDKPAVKPAEKAAPPAVELPAAPAAAAKPAAPPAEAPTPPPPKPAAVAEKPASAAPAPAAEAAREANFPALLERCRTAFNQGKMREAATACAAAKDANGESGEALLLLAHVEFNRNHLKDALQWAEKAIKADPNLADAYVIFGGVQQDAGRNREAKWAYKKYLELAPRGQYAADLRAIVDTL